MTTENSQGSEPEKDQVLRTAKEAEHRKCKSFRITDQIHEFLEGTLYIVEFEDDEQSLQESYVHSRDGKLAYFKEPVDVLRFYGRVPEPSNALRVFKNILRPDAIGVAGLIALVVTFSIVGLSIAGRAVPGELANALSLILGFYFGTMRT